MHFKPWHVFVIALFLTSFCGVAYFYLHQNSSRPEASTTTQPVPEPKNSEEAALFASLPPDPGEAGKATVEGVDSNNNGVRDDVERWITLNYSNSEKTRKALYQEARAWNKILSAGSKNDPDEAMKAWDQEEYSNACLIYVLGVDQKIRERKYLQAEFLNTRQRSLAYLNWENTLRGKVLSEPYLPDKKKGCDFDPDVLPN